MMHFNLSTENKKFIIITLTIIIKIKIKMIIIITSVTFLYSTKLKIV